MDRILGQDRAIDVLQAQLAGDRLHHAYVFGGPTGVGKFTTALAFARVLLCHDRQQDLTGRIVACDACSSCRLIPASPADDTAQDAHTDMEADETPVALAGTHPDLHIVVKELATYSSVSDLRNRKQLNIPVDLLRERLVGGKTSDQKYHEPRIGKAASLDHGRVVIIDQAELMDWIAQNLMLKTLEEPPARTTIILVTSSEDRLLATIRSRCHRIAFVPVTDDVIEAYVRRGLPGWIGRADSAIAAAKQALDEAKKPERKQREARLEAAKHHRDWLAKLEDAKRLRWLVSFADGSFGRAKLAIDWDLTEWAEVVLPTLDRIAAGRPNGALGQEIAKRIDEFARSWVDRHDNASKEAANKLAADLMGALIATEARRRLTALAEQGEGGDVVAEEARLEPWLGVIDAVQRMRELLGSNVNLSLVCDHLVAMMTQRLARAEMER